MGVEGIGGCGTSSWFVVFLEWWGCVAGVALWVRSLALMSYNGGALLGESVVRRSFDRGGDSGWLKRGQESRFGFLNEIIEIDI